MDGLPGRLRRIAVLSVGRSDIGIYETLLDLISEDPQTELDLLLTGSHYDPKYGDSFEWIRKKKWNFVSGLEMNLVSDTPGSIGKSIGLGIQSLSQYFSMQPPDLLVVLGDRTEMICGPMAALGFNIPVAHIHGGAVTEGAIDDLIRHSITKLSHLHFVSCEDYAARVKRLGEEEWRVFNFGAPGLDRFLKIPKITKSELFNKIGSKIIFEKFILVTFHPVTLDIDNIEFQINELMKAIILSGYPCVITYPNNDLGTSLIVKAIEIFQRENPEKVILIRQAGTEIYSNLMYHASIMVGNSSSGIVETTSFSLPVVNIGNRQKGKMIPLNVIQSDYDHNSILLAIDKCNKIEFKEFLQNYKNPYGDGESSYKIFKILKEIPINQRLFQKKFIDTI